MHTERPTEAKAIVILDMLKSLSDHRRPNEPAHVTFLRAQRLLQRSVSAEYTQSGYVPEFRALPVLYRVTF
jgi:hypothetical protein